MYLVIWCCEIEKLRWIDGLEKKKEASRNIERGKILEKIFRDW